MPGPTSSIVSDARVMPGIFSPSSRVGIVLDELRDDERFLRVGLHDLRVDHLAGDVEKRRDVDAVARFEHAHAARAARIEQPHPLAAVRHQRLGQIANAEILGPQMPFAERLRQMRHGLLGAIEFVTPLEFAVFESHG